jgi:hypothetical protein
VELHRAHRGVARFRVTRLLTLKKPCGYDLHPHNRYHFQNALEELDAPGEWFYDKHSGVLYFWPSGLRRSSI